MTCARTRLCCKEPEQKASTHPKQSLPSSLVAAMQACLPFATTVFQSERDDVRFAAWMRRAQLQEEADALRAKLKESHLSAFRREAKNRTAVLRRLGHVSEEGTRRLSSFQADTPAQVKATTLHVPYSVHAARKHGSMPHGVIRVLA